MENNEKQCPYCGESIKLVAIKCKHCGEFLSEEEVEQDYARSPPSLIRNNYTQQFTQLNNSANNGSNLGAIFKGIGGLIPVLLLVMFLTNPSKSDFYQYFSQQASRGIDKYLEKHSTKHSNLDNIISKVAKATANIVVMGLIHQRNYFIYSEYEIDTTLVRILDPNVPRLRFIAIFGKFFPIDSKEWVAISNTYGTKKLEENKNSALSPQDKKQTPVDSESIKKLLPNAQELPNFLEGTSYSKVREKLILNGWKPIQQKNETDCWGSCKTNRANGLFENEICASSGEGNCLFVFKNSQGRTIKIVTRLGWDDGLPYKGIQENKYVIQVGAFATEERVQRWVNKFKEEQIPNDVFNKTHDGKMFFVLRAGPFTNLNDAESAFTKISSLGLSPRIVELMSVK